MQVWWLLRKQMRCLCLAAIALSIVCLVLLLQAFEGPGSSVSELTQAARHRPAKAHARCNGTEHPRYLRILGMITGDKLPNPKASLARLLQEPRYEHLDMSLKQVRRIGAVIAVHPPKYYAVAMFLDDWMRCLGAFRAMSVYLVFVSSRDLDLFRAALACMNPHMPEVWTPVIAAEPFGGWPLPEGYGNQIIAAYKKFMGIAAMLDIGREDYGLMLDAELSLYDFYAKAGTGKACDSNGAWSKLLSRIKAMEGGKRFSGSRVNAKLSSYNFSTHTMDGRIYDRYLLEENARFITPNIDDKSACSASAGCQRLRAQIDEVVWSWWTDLPWLNLAVVRRMLAGLKGFSQQDVKSWKDLARSLAFPRFEYVAYQMWCVLHEGFEIIDVTEITKEAKWGSYLEDPQPGSRLGELKPMWASAETVDRAEDGILPALSVSEPPLLIFHNDHTQLLHTSGGLSYKLLWEKLLLDLLAKAKRRDFDESSIS